MSNSNNTANNGTKNSVAEAEDVTENFTEDVTNSTFSGASFRKPSLTEAQRQAYLDMLNNPNPEDDGIYG